MKKLILLLIIAVVAAGCSITPNNNQQNQTQNQPQNTKPPVTEIVRNFEQKLFPTTNNMKVVQYTKKKDIIKSMSTIMENSLASKYVDAFYIEKEDGLHVIAKNTMLFNQSYPLQLKKITDDSYEISQINGDYHLVMTINKSGDNWLVSDYKAYLNDVAYEPYNIMNFDSITLLANKENNLPNDYIPSDLTKVNVPFYFAGESEKKYLRKEAAEHLEQLFNEAKNENIALYAASGYRSYKTQEALFTYYTKEFGSEEAANRVSAYPGQSEHQSGLAMDVTSKKVNFHLLESFGDTKEGLWLKNNAHKFGFIIRYPKGKENITEYDYEPWHLRYVGQKVATEIFNNQGTLEEYLVSKY